MMRAVLLWASRNPLLAQRLPRLRFVQRAVRRFMPGEAPEDALREAARLAEERLGTVFTLLGENVTQPGEAALVVEHYQSLLTAIVERRLQTEISVKLTQLGSDLDESLCRTNLEAVVSAGLALERMVWVDIESSPYVDATLRLYRHVREQYPNVGLCLQAYLYRTAEDLEALLPLQPAIRLVKGAYAEPREVAFPKKRDVDENFHALSCRLLDAAPYGVRAAFATHDERLVKRVKDAGAERGMSRGDLEFQMLYGINTALQRSLAAEGHTVRTLISYGREWFPWYMRRLAERPANLWFVMKNVVST
jgi:proline dehydrogenase